MAGAKKFGTFAGVYTPSVLTILGVIMYLRLGWVVGQAGLIATIAIVIIAHIISITTSLSISSIATDKKIKTGGIYYILSRSLGLPMGGSIGITLFVGTALSIALYIVGFTENFLGIEAISNFLGMESDINSVRIIGTIVLIIIAGIAFISTSFALKTQFFVLGAIALSLVSIGLGFAFYTPDTISAPILSQAGNGIPIITVFAIFFPAVTGFTAGVAMSGDLEDPKSSIPKGTMLAVATGLIVYLALSVSIAYFVDRDTLLTDNNFLMTVAIYSPLVVAGIWGATLSSALGGILGAPRIIQAISNDKVVPAFLGKGHGESNEPRNALIFTFVLAEIGVLIGELDAIAEVVSMFYIAAYGFINLAFALESWASSDFRPSFRINKWIGIIGFIASFGVMMQLNPVAMFASFVIMWLIYFLLKRKEIKSDFGDVWGSVWTSLVRTSITKLSEQSLEKRNWKPNILLFSGGNDERPELFDIGKKFIGKYGFLSAFDLKIKNDNNNFSFTKNEQQISNSEESNGIFVRQHSVNNIYDGIEQISSTYGFAGVEPNTIFMGWARNTKEPLRFAKMLKNIYSLDLNVIMMDYDYERKYGNKKQIDVWWRGKGQNGNLSLQLVKFLQESDDWSKATLRLMVINQVNSELDEMYRQASNILSNLRIEGEVRVINNEIEKRSFYDIINVESVNSSIIFLGLPDIAEGDEEQFVEKTNELCHKIGSVVLVRASTQFLDLNIGGKKRNKAIAPKNIPLKIEVNTDIHYPKFENLRIANTDYKNKIEYYIHKYNERYLLKILEHENELLQDFSKTIRNIIGSIKIVTEKSKAEHLPAKIASIHTKTFSDIKKKIKLLNNELVLEQKQILDNFIREELSAIKRIYLSADQYVSIKYNIDDIQKDKFDILDIRLYKSFRRLLAKLGKKTFSYKINYQQLLSEKLFEKHILSFEETLNNLGQISVENITNIEIFATTLDKEIQSIYQLSKEDNNGDFSIYLTRIQKGLKDLELGIRQRMQHLIQMRENSIYQLVNELNTQSAIVAINNNLDEEFIIRKAFELKKYNFEGIPEKRLRNQKMLINRVQLNIYLLTFSVQLRQFTNLITKRIRTNLERDLLQNQNTILDYLKNYKSLYSKKSDAIFDIDQSAIKIGFDKISSKQLVQLINKTQKNILSEMPVSIEIFSEESDNLVATNRQYDDLETINLSVIRLIDYIIQDEFTNKMEKIISELPDQILEYNQNTQDHIRFIKYSSENKNTIEGDFADFIDNEISELEKKNKIVSDFIHDKMLQIEERQRIITDKLSLYPFIQTSMNLKQYIKQRESDKKTSKLSVWKHKTHQWLRNKAANLWYRQSEGILLTKELLEEDNEYQLIRKKRKAISRIKASNNIIETIPYYYKQLFTNRQNFIPEFWISRPNEEEEIQEYINDKKNNLAKALLINGLPGSGKSHLGFKLASMFSSATKVYTIIPPSGGSISINTFNTVVKNAIEPKNNLSELGSDSVIIFEDIELWWEKTTDGFEIIDNIFDLINKYSEKYSIIIIINSFAYKFINELRDCKNIFTHSVNISPMPSKSLEQMIWKRHQAGGLKLRLYSKTENSLHSWDFARLFSKYFKTSNGLVNTATYNWINSIDKIEDKYISAHKPNSLSLNLFDDLSQKELWLLQTFILHKHLTYSKIESITSINKSFVMRKLLEFKRIGIIDEISNNIYEINPLVLPYIMEVLKTKNYL